MKINKSQGRTVMGWTQHDIAVLNELLVKANDFNLLSLTKVSQQELENRIALRAQRTTR